MASNVSSIITSSDLGGGLIPVEYSREIIQQAPKSSVLLTRARHVQMSERVRTQPVLDALPLAYWVGGDTGLKQTTKMKWGGLSITAEELAVIVPVPEAVIADSAIDVWAEVTPRLAAAIGLKVDQAGIFGVDRPSTWPEGIVPQCFTSGNYVEKGTTADLAGDVAYLGQMLSEQGFAIDGFASKPGMGWELTGLRSSEGVPIYTSSLPSGGGAGLYGYPLNEVRNGAWDSSKALILAADWSNFVVGIRQDLSYKFLDQAVITDDDGKVILNLAQQDCIALRVTFRVGFQIANPMTELQSDSTKRFPAGVVTPATTGSSGTSTGALTDADYDAGAGVMAADMLLDDAASVSGADDATTAAEESETPTMDNTVAEIRDYASQNGIDLTGCSTKAEMLAAIAAAQE